MSTRHVRKWIIAAPILGFLVVGCGSSNTTFPGVGGSGNGGTSSGGTGGDQGGSGGSSAGTDSGGTGGSGAAGTGGTGGSGGTAGSGGAGGSGITDPEIDYEPVGLGDPWFFSSASDLEAFEVELKNGATGSATWTAAGEVHMPLTFTAAAQEALIFFSAPWDSVAEAHDMMDLTHRVLRARVKVADGATATGGVQAYSQSTSGWTWVNGTWNSIPDLGSWTEVEFDFDTATAPTDVLRFGLQVYSNGAGSAELIIDDLRLEPKAVQPEPDGGITVPDAGGGGDEPDAGGGGDEPDAGGGGDEPDAGGGGTGGSGGLGYEPVGIGDPWFFDAEPEMSAFVFALGSGATESHAWSNGEIHITANLPGSGATVQMHFTTPWNGSTNTADLSGRVIRARMRVADGATADAGVQVFTQSNGWDWRTGDWNGIGQLGSYTDVTFPMTSATNAASVQRFGLQLYANSAGTVELIIDNLRIEPAL